MNVSCLVAAGVLSICSLPTVAAPIDSTAQTLRIGPKPAVLLARGEDGTPNARDGGDPRVDEASTVASAKPVQKTRAQVKQEVLDAIADGTLPGPGENLGYAYGESIRTVLRPRQSRTARGMAMQP